MAFYCFINVLKKVIEKKTLGKICFDVNVYPGNTELIGFVVVNFIMYLESRSFL